MVMRDVEGHIVFASLRHMFTCNSALAAELEACREGVALAMEWSSAPFILETGCSEAAAMLMHKSTDRSKNAGLVHEIKASIYGGREVKVRAIRRESNQVSNELARIGRACVKTAVWLRSAPEEVVNLCSLDHPDPD
ncbi:hypothetical protein VPH35_119636 [Triticum aestivum]